MPKFNSPEPFNFERPAELPEWKQRFARFRVATKLADESGEVQVSSLIYAMGREAENIYSSFTFPCENDRNDYEAVLAKFDAHFVPMRNIIYERTCFHQRTQKPGETVESFVRALYDLSEYCEFGITKTEQIRDRIVIGIRDREVSEKLQMMSDLKLETAIDLARHSEMVRLQNKDAMNDTSTKDLEAVTRRYTSRKPGSLSVKQHHPRRPHNQKQECGRCGRIHNPNNCPTKQATCRICRKRGHFAIKCHTKIVHDITTTEYSDTGGATNTAPFFFSSITCDDESEPAWRIHLDISGTLIDFKIDSGADATIISETAFKMICPRPQLKPVQFSLNSPGGPLTGKGQIIARTKVRGETFHIRLIVVKGPSVDNLLSRSTAVQMGLIKRLDDIQQFPPEDVFGDIGLMRGSPVKITLKGGAVPYSVNTSRRIPFPLMPKVVAELRRMQTHEVIEPVTEASEWCAPIVPAIKKNGQLRICVDLKKLNQSVEREKHNLPILDEILPRLAGSTMFTTLDASSGFWQLPLYDASSRLTTFITPVGRFRFKRLPFGVTCAPEIFQRKMEELLNGLPGVEVIMDDILIHGAGRDEHDNRLARVLERIQSSGLKLNLTKCTFRQNSLDFMGHTISAEGVSPHPDKVKAIRELKAPENVRDLRMVLGMVNYLGRFLPNLSTVVRPMNELLQKDTAWTWGPPQEKAFNDVKDMITTAPVLAYYDPGKSTVLSADASSYGLGGVLLQQAGEDLKPVAFCSRTLTEAERKYAQIEKECLAALWASERFSRYLVGLESYKVLTDHKPLVPLINTRDFDRVPARCQRMLLRFMRFNPRAVYTPGKSLVIADTLSRNPLQITSDECSELEQDVAAHIDVVETTRPISQNSLDQIRSETSKDQQLSTVLMYTQDGWPKYIKDVEPVAHEYFAHQSDLSALNGLLVYGTRIVIPSSLRAAMLQCIHEGHQGITKSRERAEQGIWWPGISADIKRTVNSCEYCQSHKPNQHKEPLIVTELPDGPWMRVPADLCDIDSTCYMVVVDYYYRFIEITHMPRTTSECVIQKLKAIFARYGVPVSLVTDNGTQFTSYKFNEFARDYDFHHTTISPGNSQANGEAERAVATAKSILKQPDPPLALMAYRSTPLQATGVSPAQLLMGRRIRTTVPVLPDALKPEWPNLQTVAEADRKAKQSYKMHYDRRHGARALPDLNPGDSVGVKLDQEKGWKPATVLQKSNVTPCSYVVETTQGTYRRNRRHIRQRAEPDSVSNPVEMEHSLNTPDETLSETTPSNTGSEILHTQVQQGTRVTRYGRPVKVPQRFRDE